MLPIRHIVLSILILLPALATAAVPTTNVTGSFNLPSGVNPNNVTLTLTPSHEFQVQDSSGNKYQIPKVPQVFSIPNAGAVNINIIPNTGRSNSPDLTTYSVKLQAGRYVDESLTWQVGYNTLGINLSDLRVSTPSNGSSSFLELVGGVLTGKVTLASTNTLPGLRWPVTTEPTGASAGDTYINSSDFKLYVYNGIGSWLASTGAGLTSIFHYTDLSGSGTSGAPLYITPGAAGSVLLTNTAGTTVTATALTGDVTVNGLGVTAIGAGKVISSHFADNSITAVKLSPTAGITTTQILNETITGSDVANNSLTAVDLSPTAGITTTQIADGTIANADVSASAAIVYSKLSLATSIVVGDLATALANRINSATATNGGLSYGNGTNYSTSAAGTAGQVAVSGGAGAPTWSDPPLSVLSGGYVTRSGSNLLFAPDKSNRVFCFESSVWKSKTIADAGITVACTGLSNSTDYYLYVYDSDANGTADALDLTTTAPTTQNGIQVKTGATSRLLIARCRSNASGAITTYADDASTQLVNNVYNKRRISLIKKDSTDSWNYTTNTFRQANASTANQVSFVADGTNSISCSVMAWGSNSSTVLYTVGIGVDSTSVNSATFWFQGSGSATGANTQATQAWYEGVPSAGIHDFVWLEKSTATGTTTWFGDNNSAGVNAVQSGIWLLGNF